MKKLALTCLTALVLSAPALADPHNVFGTYLTHKGNAKVTISDCGDGSPCGRVAWVDPASLPDGITPETAKIRSGEPVLGLLMVQGFERKTRDWRGGTIYDPEVDRSFNARLARLETGDLQVKGCVGAACRTLTWQEVDPIE